MTRLMPCLNFPESDPLKMLPFNLVGVFDAIVRPGDSACWSRITESAASLLSRGKAEESPGVLDRGTSKGLQPPLTEY
jgi:hypothetical protein